MDLYDVIISPTAKEQLRRYVDYIQYTLLNEDAADAVMMDALETIDELEKTAGSLAFCNNQDLKELGYN